MRRVKTSRPGSKSSSPARGSGRPPSGRTSSVPERASTTQVAGRGRSTAGNRGRSHAGRAPSDLGLVSPAGPAVPDSRADNESDLSFLTLDRLMEVIHAEVQRASAATVSSSGPSTPLPYLPSPSISGGVVLLRIHCR